jgi:type I restriction enzyme S subunit
MKLETFFEKFDQFADAPDAVVKMRELVLELAATGRLVPEVLERPVTEDTKLMGTLVELVMGQAPAGTECNTEGRGTVFVKVGEFGPLYPREEVWTTNPLKFAKKGDVLVCVVGATVGKLNLAIDCAIGRSAAAIRPSSALDTKFLYYSLVPYTLRLRRNSRGSAQGVIGKVELNAVSLWVPSREVQKRIVAKVDELMALCDRLALQQQERETRHAALARASLARFADEPTPANLTFLFHPSYAISPADLRKSILTLAVQGKLVPQDPNDEPAEAPALSRVTKSKGEREAPFELPGNWKWMQLGRVSELINGDRSKNYPNKAEYVPEGVAWINTGHIEPDGTLSTEWMHFITRKKFDSLRSGKVRPGDLVYCLRGATLGKTAIITQYEEGAVASSLVIIRLIPAVEPRFAYRFLTSPLGREQIFQFDNGSAQPNLSANSVKKYWVPLPPLAEQRRIVAKVEQLMALVDALETQLATSCATAENLLAAVVAELTEGTHASPAC